MHANYLCGISPLTRDLVNPAYPWPEIQLLKKECESKGYLLRRRLPVYSEFINRDGFVSERIREVIRRLNLYGQE